MRDFTFLKYFLSLKLAFFCRKIRFNEEEKYFNEFVKIKEQIINSFLKL
jgi:hypothetical protein